ncbi:helix-turn-helix transcriptional regulator [Cryomorphaceae bacterium 1068]|nr:helix-turn-helix transcriptional regulator [Cryomorphaceae bacterium 1068]
MKEDILNQARELYRSGSKNREAKKFDGEVELSEFLMNTFHIGDYFFLIYSFPNQEMEYCSAGTKDVLSIDPKAFSLTYIIENMHPDDLKNFMRFEGTLLTFLPTIPPEKLVKYKVSYDYRIKDGKGNYKRLLHQVMTLQNEDDGALIRTFAVLTDITHLKTDTHMQLNLIGLDGEPSFYNVKEDNSYTSGESPLSEREREVLAAMADGLNSVEIAEKLEISKHTVNIHRKNILEKTNAKSSLEALKVALTGHWI